MHLIRGVRESGLQVPRPYSGLAADLIFTSTIVGKAGTNSNTIELFRQYTEKQRQAAQGPQPKRQAQEERSEHTESPNLVVEMSRIEHEVHQIFDDASSSERDNIIRFLEVVVRNLKRQTQ